MAILVVGGDSVDAMTEGHATAAMCLSNIGAGGKNRDSAKAIPKDTEAVVFVLGLVSHTLVRKVRSEATRRGLPVFFQKRGRQSGWRPGAVRSIYCTGLTANSL